MVEEICRSCGYQYGDNYSDFQIKNDRNSVSYNRISNDLCSGFWGNDEKNYKINIQQIFNKGNAKIGDRFEVKIRVDYSLDSKMYSKILDYEVECIEAPQYPPNWFMFLFPGAW